MSSSGIKVKASVEQHREISDFLFQEALLLDEGRFKEWLWLIDEHIEYRLITPNLTQSTARELINRGETVLMHETYGSFKIRIQQLTTPAFTVAENPRPFTRRFVTNVMIDYIAQSQTFHVISNALVHRSRGNQMNAHVFSMVRRDIICRSGEQLKLRQRLARLDESVVEARNLTALW